RIGLNKLLYRLPSPVSWSYTILVVLVGWVFFRIEDFEFATDYLNLMFVYKEATQVSIYHYINSENASILALGLLFSTQLPVKTIELLKKLLKFKSTPISLVFEIGRSLLLIALFLSCIIYENAESYNPFIYFRF
ncbi:hypothetical protein OAE48_04035, partial [Flavobacteriales bacterium]|nr:hypothetical protein [Flavobacteriales bacterium]